MEHTPAATKIYYTSEYRRFKTITGNRELNEKKINKIVADISAGTDLLRFCPILVHEKDERLHIVDGQHRFFVSKKLKSPVWYTITDDITLYDIAKLNSNTEKWKAKDFINCYTQLGNENYATLQKLLDDYNLPVTTAISLLQAGRIGDGGSVKHGFEKGDFKVKHKDFTIEIISLCKQFNYTHSLSRGFIKSVIKIKEKGVADIQELIDKVNEDPEKIPMYGDYKEFVTALEAVYNTGKRNRVTIF